MVKSKKSHLGDGQKVMSGVLKRVDDLGGEGASLTSITEKNWFIGTSHTMR